MKNDIHANLSRRIKLHIKAQPHIFKANAHLGFENTLAKELSIPGVEECEIETGVVHFRAKLEKVWQIAVLSHCARSLEMKIAEFHCENFGKLEREIQKIQWELYLPQNAKVNVKVFSEKSRLYHKGAVEERVGEVISKFWGHGIGDMGHGAGDMVGHEFRVCVRLMNDVCSVWVDLCGEALHKRGDRWVEDAPLQETLAASILLSADFAKYKKLIDPMAGSGVFSLEAAKWLSNSELKLTRDFDFVKMPSFREAAFNNFLQKSKQAFALNENENFEILCSDKDSKAVKTITHNLRDYSSAVSINQADFFSLPPVQNALLVLNPPYGKRLGKEKNLYAEIVKKIEKDFSKCAFAIICPPPEAEKILHSSAFKNRSVDKIQSYNGGLKVIVLRSAC